MPLLANALDPAGPAARDIEDLWKLLLWLGTATFLVFAVLLVLALFRRSRNRDHDATDTGPDDTHGRTVRPWLIGGGVVLPTVGVVVVLVATIFTMQATATEPGDDALTIEVTGSQWWWGVTYPDHDVVTANEVHIPAGEPVRLVLTSTDVIHSFWVPSLAGKLDALPDGDNVLVIEADEPGRYNGSCAEFCGIQHASMDISVVAHTPAEFQTWLEETAQPAAEPETEIAAEGQEVFQSADCGSCHTIRGTDASGDSAPDLTHLASRKLSVDDLHRWLSDPHDVREGTTMPDPNLSESEVDALVAYLESLG